MALFREASVIFARLPARFTRVTNSSTVSLTFWSCFQTCDSSSQMSSGEGQNAPLNAFTRLSKSADSSAERVSNHSAAESRWSRQKVFCLSSSEAFLKSQYLKKYAIHATAGRP